MDIFAIYIILSTLTAVSGLSTGVLPADTEHAAVEGSVTLTTTLNSTEKLQTVSWTFKNTVICQGTLNYTTTAPGYKDRITLNIFTGSLELRNLTSNDGGEYRVNMTTADGDQMTGTTTLLLYEPVSEANITRPPSTLIEGQNSTNITCAASGNIGTTEWLKDGQPLQTSDRVTFIMNNSTVSINPVNRSDNGQYLCQLSNPISSANASYPLVVNYGPDTMRVLEPAAPVIDSPILLYCSVMSVPPATFFWSFNGLDTGVREAGYVIERASYDHNGNYTCKAYNDVTHNASTYVYSLTIKAKDPIPGPSLSPGAAAGIAVAVTLIVVALVFVGLILFFGMIRQQGEQPTEQQRPGPIPQVHRSSYSRPTEHAMNPIPVVSPPPPPDNTSDIYIEVEPVDDPEYENTRIEDRKKKGPRLPPRVHHDSNVYARTIPTRRDWNN